MFASWEKELDRICRLCVAKVRRGPLICWQRSRTNMTWTLEPTQTLLLKSGFQLALGYMGHHT